eukprot:CAMPEP_0114583540 /NCGR_PEP_ID=MMETSP0125-20121206/7233_1 /TAXON_ID=485358 ORGANISM="Aristerostoma sp., Strain ATCC 50986" /NCGR_SAMPLE_ID=MMETSP0125 /ASSEMBLY_ACC=CAM_ASM_000245 /LENGTH=70 /DNA_ID=CAMNT_0001777019 /DNA_START=308 /DNA_END=520 /DNA_ORIENTATION=-
MLKGKQHGQLIVRTEIQVKEQTQTKVGNGQVIQKEIERSLKIQFGAKLNPVKGGCCGSSIPKANFKLQRI